MIYNKQTLLDISVQRSGTVENLFVLAEALGQSVTDKPMDEALLVMPERELKNKKVLKKYEQKHTLPATGDDHLPAGIGYYAVGVNGI